MSSIFQWYSIIFVEGYHPAMSLPDNRPDIQADWEVTPEGLYIATRHFLLRRGYCCANRCRNCPYVNWRENPAWQHAPAEAIRRATVSPKTLAGVRAALARQSRPSRSRAKISRLTTARCSYTIACYWNAGDRCRVSPGYFLLPSRPLEPV